MKASRFCFSTFVCLWGVRKLLASFSHHSNLSPVAAGKKNVFYLLFCSFNLSLSLLPISKPITAYRRLESANGLHTLLLVLVPIVWIENGGAGGSPEEKQGLLTRRMLNDMQVGKTQIYLRRQLFFLRRVFIAVNRLSRGVCTHKKRLNIEMGLGRKEHVD